MRVRLPKHYAVLLGTLLALLAVSVSFGRIVSTATAAQDGGQDALVAQGKSRFQAYACYDCHGNNGEGTADGPDLTHSKLTAEQVSRFLQKPSADAANKGMPDVPVDNPDHAPLVAYVMSIRAK
jgi:mono/diheme cytochrome c family protein